MSRQAICLLSFLLILSCTHFCQAQNVSVSPQQPLHMLIPSKKEIAEFEKELANVTDRKIPETAKGALLFDGKVIKALRADRFGEPCWLVRTEHIYTGKEQVSGNTVVLVSPTLRYAGVILSPGQRYRFIAVNFDISKPGKRNSWFYVWKGTILQLTENRSIKSRS